MSQAHFANTYYFQYIRKIIFMCCVIYYVLFITCSLYCDYFVYKLMSNINEFKVLVEQVYHIINTIYQNHASVVYQLT